MQLADSYYALYTQETEAMPHRKNHAFDEWMFTLWGGVSSGQGFFPSSWYNLLDNSSSFQRNSNYWFIEEYSFAS